MARRSDLDLAHGDDIRNRVVISCVYCEAAVVWHSVPELAAHLQSCRWISIATAAMAGRPVEDLLQ